ncbi:MAG: SMP-30/gluconolactonase/LRE family protein [Planctomycetaceae bacterium]|nr:SMP-30/gluconolactonase/LRE family protein [Planctomycetales bacterium]MCB9923267.1 SMP-30/gluconolactonase/LRE family protein [Planctomycetaceae bacterium]
MRTWIYILVAGGLVCFGVSSTLLAADPIPGIGPKDDVRKLHGDLQFTEGPTWDGQGNLYFSDIPANRIYKVDASGTLSVFIEPSNHTNGLMVNHNRLLACEMDGRLVAIDLASKETNAIVSKYRNQRFNAPNDLVIDREGGIYFTDPHFRAPMPLPQEVVAVYYATEEGQVSRLIDDLKAPNGVILSPDEKTLYVIPSLQKQMMAYPVTSPGKLGPGKVFCELQQPEGKDDTGGDGLTIDTQGNLYITSGLGIQVYSPDGKWLGIISFPEQPANCSFGGSSNQTLFVTARTSLYAVEMEAKGHVFPGKAE